MFSKQWQTMTQYSHYYMQWHSHMGDQISWKKYCKSKYWRGQQCLVLRRQNCPHVAVWLAFSKNAPTNLFRAVQVKLGNVNWKHRNVALLTFPLVLRERFQLCQEKDPVVLGIWLSFLCAGYPVSFEEYTRSLIYCTQIFINLSKCLTLSHYEPR